MCVTVTAPPSKSLTHRALIAAACARGVSTLANCLESDDCVRTREALTVCGALFERDGGHWRVRGVSGAFAPEAARRAPLSVFVGESGTTCRLLTALLAAGRGCFRIHGAGRMHERPLGELARVLRELGAGVEYEDRPGCPPLLLTARGLDRALAPGGMANVSCEESSQYLSGLLLAAPVCAQGLDILLGGAKVLSWPYVALTLEVMEHFGARCTVETADTNGGWSAADRRALTEAKPGATRFRVSGGGYEAAQYTVEGDWSGASYFLAAGAIGPRAVRVEGLNPGSLQADAAILGMLEAMGARIERGAEAITVHPGPLRGITANLGACPDIAPTVAALAAHARGHTRIVGAAHLALKESDRLNAPAAELRRAGCTVEVTADGLVIDPPEGGPKAPPDGAPFLTYGDHRLAMSLALLGLPGTHGKGFAARLDNPACVSKSFPGFWELWMKVAGATSPRSSSA